MLQVSNHYLENCRTFMWCCMTVEYGKVYRNPSNGVRDTEIHQMLYKIPNSIKWCTRHWNPSNGVQDTKIHQMVYETLKSIKWCTRYQNPSNGVQVTEIHQMVYRIPKSIKCDYKIPKFISWCTRLSEIHQMVNKIPKSIKWCTR